MRLKSMKTAARIAAIGVVTAVGPGSAQPVLAAPQPVVPPGAVIQVPCITSALVADITGAVSGDTLSLMGACKYQLTSPLPLIRKNLTIQGNGATIQRSYIPDTPDFSILTVTSGAVLVLNYLNLRNGNSGGNISLPGTGRKDSAAMGAGAPVYDSGYGGAIFNENGDVTVNGGTLSNNNSRISGGAIYSLARLRVHRVIFNGNTSEYGGAIANSFNHCAIAKPVSDCAIAGPEIATTLVTFSTFNANRARYGGAIYVERSMTAANSGFTNNTAEDGGGIYVYDGSPTVAGSYFRHNQAGYGGGIYNHNIVTMNDSIVTGNFAEHDGGGIYNTGSITLTNSVVENNQPDNCAPISVAGCTG